MMNPSFELRVVGHGPVGLALALFAQRAGVPHDCIVFDPPLPDRLSIAPAMASRRLALSLGSWHLLGRVGAQPRSAPISRIEISLAGKAGKTQLDAGQLGVAMLGQVCDYQGLMQALDRAWRASGKRPVLDNNGADRRPTERGETAAPVQVVTVHAEGLTGDDARVREFEQHALQATLRCPQQPAGLALERFTPQGPAALLPLAEPQGFTLVWCGSAADTERRMALSADAFVAQLQALFGPRLRAAELVDRPVSTPLQRRQRRSVRDLNAVWIGNAAQTLHPVAGQGLNLGLRDAFVLAGLLGELARRQRQADIAQTLARFERVRARDRAGTIGVTDTLATILTVRPLAGIQSLALTALDFTPGVKRRLARRFMFGAS